MQPKLPKRWFPKYGNNIIKGKKVLPLTAVLKRREEVEPMLALSFTTVYRFFYCTEGMARLRGEGENFPGFFSRIPQISSAQESCKDF